MSKGKSTLVALLRGINVAGKKKIPMAELRALAEDEGFASARTYIQSGNLVFRTSLSPAAAQKSLEKAIANHFGFEVEIVVLAGTQWLAYARTSAFPDAEKSRPKTLLLAISKTGPKDGAVDLILGYAVNERAKLLGDAIWIDFVDGSGRSKVTPAVLQKALGKSATTRNWRTVGAIADLVREVDAS